MRRSRLLLVLFIGAGLALVVVELAGGDFAGALWAALRVLGRLA